MRVLRSLARRLGLIVAEPRHRLQVLRFRELAAHLRRLCGLADEARSRLVGGWVIDRRYTAAVAERALELAEAIVFDSYVLGGSVRGPFLALDARRRAFGALLSESQPEGGPPLEAEADGRPWFLAEAARLTGCVEPEGPDVPEHGILWTSDRDRPLDLRLERGDARTEETHYIARHGGAEGPAVRYRPLITQALLVERLAGRPQRIEWRSGRQGFELLASTPLQYSTQLRPRGERASGIWETLGSRQVLARAGSRSAVAGVSSGRVRHVWQVGDLERLDDLEVGIVHVAAPRGAAQCLWRAAGLLVRDAEAAAGWMDGAADGRVPLLAGFGDSLDALADGSWVTLDAHEGVVYEGTVGELLEYHLLDSADASNEQEQRLLARLMGSLGRGTLGPGTGGEPTLFDVVQQGQALAIDALERLAWTGLGRRAGALLQESGWPGTLRLLDIGMGAADTGGGLEPLALDQLRCVPLRALLEAFGPEGPGRKPEGDRWGLALASEEGLTLRTESPDGVVVIDATVGDHPASNTIYCAFHPAARLHSRTLLERVGFRVVDLGPDRVAWLHQASAPGTREALRALGRETAGTVT